MKNFKSGKGHKDNSQNNLVVVTPYLKTNRNISCLVNTNLLLEQKEKNI